MVGPLGSLGAALERSVDDSVPDAPDEFDEDSGANVLGGEACCWTELCDDSLLPLRLWPTAAVVAAELRGDLDHRATPRHGETVARRRGRASARDRDRSGTAPPRALARAR